MHNDRHCHWTHRKMCDQITHDTLLQYGRDMDSKLQNNDSPSLNRPSTSSPPATQANFLVRKGHALSSAPRQEVEPKEQILQAERLVPRLSVNNRAKPLETDRQSSSNYDDELEQTYSPQTSDKGVFPYKNLWFQASTPRKIASGRPTKTSQMPSQRSSSSKQSRLMPDALLLICVDTILETVDFIESWARIVPQMTRIHREEGSTLLQQYLRALRSLRATSQCLGVRKRP